jgi:dTDP-glucose 4,6-dehydratase
VKAGVSVTTLDSLTYAANRAALEEMRREPLHTFIKADITDAAEVHRILADVRPVWIFHLAAETHVDRSIADPSAFVHTNVLGTFHMLEGARAFHCTLESGERAAFRFLHVSTDEVYGELGDGGVFTEQSAYQPRSPYAATKAGADHLVRAWHTTFGLPVLVTGATNNFGYWQAADKLIPLVISRAVRMEPIPVYGDGKHVRDWLFVEDHARGIICAATQGVPGRTYLFGAGQTMTNLTLVTRICSIVDSRMGSEPGAREKLITFVSDRPGHDYRYAVDWTRARTELGWTPQYQFDDALRDTVEWYVDHAESIAGWGAYKVVRDGTEPS